MEVNENQNPSTQPSESPRPAPVKVLRDDDKWIDAVREMVMHVSMCPHMGASHIRLQDFNKLSEMLEAENLKRFAVKRPLIDKPDW